MSIGKLHYSNSDMYNGVWENNKKGSQGVLYYSFIGILIYPDGSRYEGEMRDSNRNGRGINKVKH